MTSDENVARVWNAQTGALSGGRIGQAKGQADFAQTLAEENALSCFIPFQKGLDNPPVFGHA